ncbi:MAG: TonB-dependent receptor [Winogradskyella sp.]|uniref:TonB-dependent receptor n=1 Tax=Winogradskyella sp. TaxID=1883156 RepID=UPI0025CF496F|nr:TonB-dependent receptor [Winogradskyella sp.]NRB84052.1 TonB-dependent receptor [Winogradskyella sp.]
MKHILKALALIIFLSSTTSIFSQGKISGTVIDGEFNEPLAFANIVVKGTSKGDSADFDGKYELEIEAGTYTLVFSFVGYITKEITDVIVNEGEVVTLDVVLETNSLDAVVITTTTKRNTENAVLSIQKKSVVVLDGLSAQAIKNSGAGNVASAVKAVPGVSIQGDKYVFVRGLGDRYTKSILNGIDIPGLDPDRNTIQMDLFPTNILDNVIVLKSASAEYPADFTGGIVNIVTRDFPSKAEYSISLGNGYNPDMHFNDNYLTSEGSDTDWLGFDDGKRNLPVNRYQFEEGVLGDGVNTETLTNLTNSFEKELAAKRERSGMNFDFGFTLGNQYDVGDDKLGYQASFSYKNQTTFYENRIDGAYIKNPQDTSQNDLIAALDSRGSEGINNVILNGMLGLAYKTEKSKYKVNFLHIQNGESTAGFFDQVISQDGTGGGLEPLTKNSITYTERSISNILLSGKHRLNSILDEKPFTLEWKIAPTFSKVMDKDHRITPFQQADDGSSFLSPSASTLPIQLWRHLIEESWAGKLDLDKTVELFGRPGKIKFGGAFTYKFRDFSIDDFTFNIRGDQSFISNGDADNLLATENIWTPETDAGTFVVFTDNFNPNDAYEGEQQIAATYFSTEFNLTEKFKTVLGIRAEMFNSFYTGQDNENIFDRELILEELDFFPSANFIYALNDKSNLRASYSRTTARPSFKEASVAQIFDPITSRLFIGDLNLVPTYINNFDLRYEFFGEEGQMFAVSGFYKDFTDPIEQSFFVSAPTQLTVANLGNAVVYGAEFEARQRLGFISEGLNNLKVTANFSLIKSELTMSDDEFNGRVASARDGETIERERDLQGQAPYLINVGLNYDNSDIGLTTGLFYNVQGETLEVVGIREVPDVYTQPFNSLNFTLNKAFGENKRSSIDIKVSNILNDKRLSEYESFGTSNQIFSLREPSTEISLGYTFKF